MKNRYEAVVKKRIMLNVILCRCLIIVLPVVLKFLGGFIWNELTELLYIILPLSCLYITLFFKYISHHPYENAGKHLAKEYVNWTYFLILTLNISEIILIIIRSFLVFPAFNWFIGIIAIIEVFLAIHAGSQLSVLFPTGNTLSEE